MKASDPLRPSKMYRGADCSPSILSRKNGRLAGRCELALSVSHATIEGKPAAAWGRQGGSDADRDRALSFLDRMSFPLFFYPLSLRRFFFNLKKKPPTSFYPSSAFLYLLRELELCDIELD